MAIIDRAQLLVDSSFWLPASSAMSDASMGIIHEMIIGIVGDDGGTDGTSNQYAEVLCKSLNAIANKEMSDQAVASTGLKRVKAGKREEEYFEGGNASAGWKSYIANLPNVCPLFGYSPQRVTGVTINTGGTFNPLCDSVGDSATY